MTIKVRTLGASTLALVAALSLSACASNGANACSEMEDAVFNFRDATAELDPDLSPGETIEFLVDVSSTHSQELAAIQSDGELSEHLADAASAMTDYGEEMQSGASPADMAMSTASITYTAAMSLAIKYCTDESK